MIDERWRDILRRAWSVRFMALSSLLCGLQATIMVVGVDWLPLKPVVLLVTVLGINIAAIVARIVMQKDLD